MGVVVVGGGGSGGGGNNKLLEDTTPEKVVAVFYDAAMGEAYARMLGEEAKFIPSAN